MAVIFNGTDRFIEVTDPADLVLDAQTDLYSAWKLWQQASTVNAGYAPAFRTFGGDQTTIGQNAPRYYFLTNGWRVRINNGQVVSVALNLYSDNYPSPYIVMPGSGVSDRNSDAVNVNEEEIKNQSFLNGWVYINLEGDGAPGTIYPLGIPTDPSDNYADAKSIAMARKLSSFHLAGILTLGVSETIFDTHWHGESPLDSEIILTGQDAGATTFERMLITGTSVPTERNTIYQCTLVDYTGFYGVCTQSGLKGTIVLDNNYTEENKFDFCSSSVAGTGKPIVDINGSAGSLQFRHYSGGLKITNATSPLFVASIDGQGRLEIDSTCTEGTIVVGGAWNVIDNSGPNCTVIVDSNGISPWTIPQREEVIAYAKKASDNAEQVNNKIN